VVAPILAQEAHNFTLKPRFETTPDEDIDTRTFLMKVEQTNTILYCQKWSETVAFYRDVLEFFVSHQTDWFVEFQLTNGVYLSIADERRATIQSVDGQGITLSWQVADVDTMHSALQQQGIEVTSIRQKWGGRLFYFRDPEGHRIEFWQPLET
jgi:catechol 2,3-dioxygenase-like lactoylglutathione lyase family enzyme